MYLLILTLVYYNDPLDIMKILRVHFKNIIIGVLAFLLINNSKFNIAKFNSFFINIAVLFSLLSILLYLIYFIGNISCTLVTYEESQITFFRAGVLGFFNYSSLASLLGSVKIYIVLLKYILYFTLYY